MAAADSRDPEKIVPTAPEEQDAEVLILNLENAGDWAAEDSVFLELGDLLPDASGEVVLFADDELPVNILTHEHLTQAGIAESHVTAAGVDVSGLHFYSFESGITVYSPTDILIVTDGSAT